MTLTPGTRLGVYDISGLLGEGGMGQVYRAHDTRLNRDVALKVLPDSFANDPERLARFEREAQTLAALNHPNIAHIHGVEESSGVRALVMELVEGQDLSQRIARGPIPLEEALAMAKQIADALEVAHERGIIHRDLKPANIRLRPDGTVKVLDFGIAKASPPAAPAGLRETEAPTIASPAMMTAPGFVLGTAAYMSPEQAKGQPADRRCDVWAFGIVCYEMLTGASPFQRPTTAETLASVLGSPPDYSRLPADTPASIRHLLRRCLEKDPRRRLQHMGDARIEIEEALANPAHDAASPPVEKGATAKWSWHQVAAVTALAACTGTGGWLLAHRSASVPSPGMVRLSISSLEPLRGTVYGLRHLAISEDGSRMAYTSNSQLWIRPMGQKDAVAINVVAEDPFFSPDGKWVAFFGQTAGGIGLMKVPASGGTPVSIVETSERPVGGAWRADGSIVFATTQGLFQVSENGGQARVLAKPDPQRRERVFAWPQFLPDGQAVLFTVVPQDSIEDAQIALLDLKTSETSVLLRGGTGARYISTGHLVYASGRSLKAIAFDVRQRRTRGESVLLPDLEVAGAPDNGAADFALSGTGTLLFVGPNLPRRRTVAWIDRQGHEQPLALAPNRYNYARVSPDGTRIALDVSGTSRNIWIFDLKRSTMARLTSGPTEDILPVWSRDGQRVYFSSNRPGSVNFDVYSQAADGATTERVAYSGPGFQGTLSFTPDGTRLLVSHEFTSLRILDLARPDRLEPVLPSGFREWNGEVSPDGHWIAYESDESGNQIEIFLRPFPDVNGRREKISVNGGRFPVWGKNQGELYFVDLEGHMMAVSVASTPTLTLGRARKLFDWVKPPPTGAAGTPYDVSPIDGRFLVTRIVAGTDIGPADISVVLNWSEELRRLVPTN